MTASLSTIRAGTTRYVAQVLKDDKSGAAGKRLALPVSLLEVQQIATKTALRLAQSEQTAVEEVLWLMRSFTSDAEEAADTTDVAHKVDAAVQRLTSDLASAVDAGLHEIDVAEKRISEALRVRMSTGGAMAAQAMIDTTGIDPLRAGLPKEITVFATLVAALGGYTEALHCILALHNPFHVEPKVVTALVQLMSGHEGGPNPNFHRLREDFVRERTPVVLPTTDGDDGANDDDTDIGVNIRNSGGKSATGTDTTSTARHAVSRASAKDDMHKAFAEAKGKLRDRIVKATETIAATLPTTAASIISGKGFSPLPGHVDGELQTAVIEPLAEALHIDERVFAGAIAVCRGSTLGWAAVTWPMHGGVRGVSGLIGLLDGTSDPHNRGLRTLLTSIGLDVLLGSILVHFARGTAMKIAQDDMAALCHRIGFKGLEHAHLTLLTAVVTLATSADADTLAQAVSAIAARGRKSDFDTGDLRRNVTTAVSKARQRKPEVREVDLENLLTRICSQEGRKHVNITHARILFGLNGSSPTGASSHVEAMAECMPHLRMWERLVHKGEDRVAELIGAKLQVLQTSSDKSELKCAMSELCEGAGKKEVGKKEADKVVRVLRERNLNGRVDVELSKHATSFRDLLNLQKIEGRVKAAEVLWRVSFAELSRGDTESKQSAPVATSAARKREFARILAVILLDEEGSCDVPAAACDMLHDLITLATVYPQYCDVCDAPTLTSGEVSAAASRCQSTLGLDVKKLSSVLVLAHPQSNEVMKMLKGNDVLSHLGVSSKDAWDWVSGSFPLYQHFTHGKML
jgi:hypothetical protein